MIKQELEELRALTQEAKQLQSELQNFPLTKDMVKGSMSEFPYIETSFPIEGVDIKKGNKVNKELSTKLDELRKKIGQMETWLEGIEDSEMRTILRLKFRNGMTDTEIGEKLGFDRSTISYRIRKFFTKK